MKDWYVYMYSDGEYYTVDTVDGKAVRSGPSTSRDIVQATLRGKFRDVESNLGHSPQSATRGD